METVLLIASIISSYYCIGKYIRKKNFEKKLFQLYRKFATSKILNYEEIANLLGEVSPKIEKYFRLSGKIPDKLLKYNVFSALDIYLSTGDKGILIDGFMYEKERKKIEEEIESLKIEAGLNFLVSIFVFGAITKIIEGIRGTDLFIYAIVSSTLLSFVIGENKEEILMMMSVSVSLLLLGRFLGVFL